MSWSAARPQPIALARLESGMAYRLVLINAPQGSGKTWLLSEWARMRSEKGLPFLAWISLESGDNDFANFYAHLIAGCSEIDVSLVSQLQSNRRAEKLPDARSGEFVPMPRSAFDDEDQLIELINALAGLPREIALVLDEYHNIASPEIHQAISFLINYLPTNVHVYLATRSEPPLRLAHLRARREMIEIGAAELSSID